MNEENNQWIREWEKTGDGNAGWHVDELFNAGHDEKFSASR